MKNIREGKKKGYSLLVISAFALLAASNLSCAGREIRAFRFSEEEKWTVANPVNANASLGYEYDSMLGSSVMKVNYAFIAADKQNSFVIKPGAGGMKFRSIDSIRVSYKGNGTSTRFKVGLRDASGQRFVNRSNLSLSGEQWTTGTGSFTAGSNPHHWGGNNDGVMVPPVEISFVQFMSGWGDEGKALSDRPFYLGELTVTGQAADGTETEQTAGNREDGKAANDIDIKISEVGRLRPVLPTEEKILKCIIKNNSGEKRSPEITVTRSLLLHNRTDRAQFSLPLEPGEEKQVTLPLQFTSPGVHVIEVSVSGDGRATAAAETVVNVWEPAGNLWDDNPETFFGCQDSLDLSWKRGVSRPLDEDLEMMSEAGVKIVRFVLRWPAVENERGVFTWATYDRIFEACRKRNIIPYPIIFRTPEWAVISPEVLKDTPAHLKSGPWSPDPQAYARFVKEAVTRYKDYTKYWQIWNEPYARGYFWGGGPEDYVNLLKAARQAALEADPSAKIAIGAYPQGNAETEFVYKNAQGFFDIWTIHTHCKVPALRSLLKWTKQLMGKRYVSENVWLDETGYCTDPAVPDSELEKAAVVTQKLITCRAEGLGNHMWFIFRGLASSAINPRDNYLALDNLGRVRPVVLAHNTAAKALRQTSLLKTFELPGSDVTAYLFRRQGEYILTAWTGDYACGQTLNIRFSGQVNAELYDMLGDRKKTVIDGTLSLPLDVYPFFLVIADKQEKALPESVSVSKLVSMPRRVIVSSGTKEISSVLEIYNTFTQQLRGTVRIQQEGGWNPSAERIAFDIPPGSRKEFPLRLIADEKVSDNVSIPIYINFDDDTSKIRTSLNLISGIPLKKTSSMPPPGERNITDWTKLPVLDVMKDASYVQNLRLGDIDPDLHWQGPEDMSGTLYAAWDTDNLYIAFSAADDIHFQQRKDEGIWEGDSIQIAIALVCSPERPQADVELGLALTGTDTCLHYWTGGLTVKPEYTVIRTGVNTLYGIAVPWKGLQYSPVRGNLIFLSVLLNDNDGRGRKSILEWGRGIHGKKYVELFRPLILNE